MMKFQSSSVVAVILTFLLGKTFHLFDSLLDRNVQIYHVFHKIV